MPASRLTSRGIRLCADLGQRSMFLLTLKRVTAPFGSLEVRKLRVYRYYVKATAFVSC